MEKGASGGFTNATDCADYLVKKGVPFRDAHHVVGRLVAHCLSCDKALLDLKLPELKAFHEVFEQDVYEAISLNACVKLRSVSGGPAPEAVEKSIEAGEVLLGGFAI
jgi:argininosuccinate lyase